MWAEDICPWLLGIFNSCRIIMGLHYRWEDTFHSLKYVSFMCFSFPPLFYTTSHSLLWYWTLQLSPDQLYFQFYHWVISTALVTYFTEIKTYFYPVIKQGLSYLPFLLERSLESPLSICVLDFAQKKSIFYIKHPYIQYLYIVSKCCQNILLFS